jgi:hypothetical protein
MDDAPVNPRAVAAALPERKFRRLTGGPANAGAGSQQAHREKKSRRPGCLIIMRLHAQPPSAAIVGAVWRGVKRKRCRGPKIAASTIHIAAARGETDF